MVPPPEVIEAFSTEQVKNFNKKVSATGRAALECHIPFAPLCRCTWVWPHGLRAWYTRDPDHKCVPRQDYGLYEVRTECRHGIVYINISGDAIDIDTWLGDVNAQLAPYPLDDLKVVRSARYQVDANWKLLAGALQRVRMAVCIDEVRRRLCVRARAPGTMGSQRR